ncbi:polysaccharide deacetylase family protein [Aquincola sp. MAHUQ-54]|uniref:Polysaccharide deacetylase family protein n=1 Tax=Aquincola agrisoli TaxID=3119538 RepID=A0AAW9QN89_9BURK
MIKPLLNLTTPRGPRARLSTLIFHRVLDAPDPLFPEEIDAARFDSLCGWLAAWFNVLPLGTAVRHLQERTLPERALAITFDDGYEDNLRVAVPILQRHGLTAAFFVASDYLDGGCMWNDGVVEAVRRTSHASLDLSKVDDGSLGCIELGGVQQRRAAIDHLLGRLKYLEPARREQAVDGVLKAAGVQRPRTLMMRSQEVRELVRQGMAVGGHTASHPILAVLDDDAAMAEIARGKTALEEILDSPIDLFAYPNGKPRTDYTGRSVALARRAGFRAAVTTAWGAAQQGSDMFQIPRFTPWDQHRARFGLRLVANLRRKPERI